LYSFIWGTQDAPSQQIERRGQPPVHVVLFRMWLSEASRVDGDAGDTVRLHESCQWCGSRPTDSSTRGVGSCKVICTTESDLAAERAGSSSRKRSGMHGRELLGDHGVMVTRATFSLLWGGRDRRAVVVRGRTCDTSAKVGNEWRWCRGAALVERGV
jgi:hypothetical protein